MLSVIIPTRNAERALVPTLAALVPGVVAGAVRDVIVADGGSTDATAEVAELAGCSLVASPAPLGVRLREAAAAGRGDWLLFLRPGAILQAGWVSETIQFAEEAPGAGHHARAAVFRRASGGRSAIAEIGAILAAALRAPAPDQGLVIPRALYQSVGHRDENEPETALLRRLGRRHIVRLRTEIRIPAPRS